MDSCIDELIELISTNTLLAEGDWEQFGKGFHRTISTNTLLAEGDAPDRQRPWRSLSFQPTPSSRRVTRKLKLKCKL